VSKKKDIVVMKCGRWRRERNEDIKTSLSNATERGYTVWGRKKWKDCIV
jgi:hypothetical protein